MAWIESHQELSEHPKLFHLASISGLSVDACIGRLHRLWWWCLKFAEDGDLSRYQSCQIAPIETDEFREHLRTAKWIDGDLIHDWIDYAGMYLTKKYNTGNLPLLKQIWMKHGYKYGKGKGKFCKQEVSKQRVEREVKENIPNLTKPNRTRPNQPNRNTSEDEPTQAQARGRVHEALTTADRTAVTTVDRPARTRDREALMLDGFTLTPELEAWSAKEGIPNPGQYVEEFKDYWRSAGGKRKNGQPIKDWAAAFRNRLRVLKDQGKLKSQSDWKAQFLAGDA